LRIYGLGSFPPTTTLQSLPSLNPFYGFLLSIGQSPDFLARHMSLSSSGLELVLSRLTLHMSQLPRLFFLFFLPQEPDLFCIIINKFCALCLLHRLARRLDHRRGREKLQCVFPVLLASKVFFFYLKSKYIEFFLQLKSLLSSGHFPLHLTY
jgi:hypothetical protein